MNAPSKPVCSAHLPTIFIAGRAILDSGDLLLYSSDGWNISAAAVESSTSGRFCKCLSMDLSWQKPAKLEMVYTILT